MGRRSKSRRARFYRPVFCPQWCVQPHPVGDADVAVLCQSDPAQVGGVTVRDSGVDPETTAGDLGPVVVEVAAEVLHNFATATSTPAVALYGFRDVLELPPAAARHLARALDRAAALAGGQPAVTS